MPPARRAYASERIPNDEGRTFCQLYSRNRAKRFLTSTFDIRYSIFCGLKYSPHGSNPGYLSLIKIAKLMTLTI